MPALLIAEDHEDVRFILHRVFTKAGFTVCAEPDGAAALRQARLQHPDVVLTDLDMPVMNGLELCQALRDDPELHDVPVAIVSGGLQPGDPLIAQAKLCGVVLKPFANDELVDEVRQLVRVGRHEHATAGPCAPCAP